MNIRITNKEWSAFDEEQTTAFVEAVFSHYRAHGFPYFSTDRRTRDIEYRKLMEYPHRNVLDLEGKIVRQTMHGLSLAWSYMPHSWGVKCNGKFTPLELFHDDDLFRKVIRRRMSMGSNMTDNGIRKMLRMFTGAQAVSNFRPTAAAGIYSFFCNEGDTIWDMSCGFGGRMLGAHMAGVRYIGTDPSTPTYQGLIEMARDYNINATIHCMGSEDFVPVENSLDFCFTSPPYFDLERYTDEETQSYKKFPAKDGWVEGFLKKTFDNCHTGLKDGKVMAINVANTKTFKDFEDKTIEAAKAVGFTHIDTWRLALSSINAYGFKYEPIFIFQK